MHFVSREGEGRDFKVSTVRERLKAALWTVGVESVTQLQEAWKKQFKNRKEVTKTLNRETARKWLRDAEEPKFITPALAAQLGELTGFAPTWINTGKEPPQTRRDLVPGAKELMEIYEKLKPGARTLILETARLAYKAASTEESITT